MKLPILELNEHYFSSCACMKIAPNRYSMKPQLVRNLLKSMCYLTDEGDMNYACFKILKNRKGGMKTKRSSGVRSR
jgi:hypothetical protein